jgi:hypothetical protein
VRILRKNLPQMSHDLAERSYDELLDPQDGFFRQGKIDMEILELSAVRRQRVIGIGGGERFASSRP